MAIWQFNGIQALGESQILLGASLASGVSPVLGVGNLRGPWPFVGGRLGLGASKDDIVTSNK